MSDSPPEPSEPPAEPPPQLVAEPPRAKRSPREVWDRIKHHKLVQWTLAYLAIAYTLLHGAEMLAGSLSWPHGWVRLFSLLLILGVPIVVTLAWYHGARGQQRASGTEVMIISILLAIGGTLLWRDTADVGHDKEATAQNDAKPLLPEVAPPHQKSIAVLPFADMSPANDQAYMSDGIAEEILNLLAQVPDLKVIARTSSFSFKDENVPVAEIARQLNVAYVLEGSVRKSGDQLRITTQLIRAADNTHLWSEKYDRPMKDIFAVQDEIANAVVQALQIKLMGGTLSRREGGTQNLEAYQLYLRAQAAFLDNTESSLDVAEQHARRAVEVDPEFGLAWDKLADIAIVKTDNGFIAPTAGYELARKHANQALEVSPGLANAHAHLGYILLALDMNRVAAEAKAKEAIAMDPSSLIAYTIAGRTASTLGLWGEAEHFLKAGLDRDPLNPYLLWNLGNTYYLARRFEDSERVYRQLLASTPNFGWTRGYLGKTLIALGRTEEGLKLAEQDVDDLNRFTYLPILLRAAGRKTEADAALAKQIEVLGGITPFYVAQTYAHRGDPDRALEWLDRSYELGDPNLVEIVGEPIFDDMVDDPRFRAFLHKIKALEPNPSAAR
jgi:TolB-like protein